MISYRDTDRYVMNRCVRWAWHNYRKPLNPLKNNNHVSGFPLKSNVLRIYTCTGYMKKYIYANAIKIPELFCTQKLSVNLKPLLSKVFLHFSFYWQLNVSLSWSRIRCKTGRKLFRKDWAPILPRAELLPSSPSLDVERCCTGWHSVGLEPHTESLNSRL